MTAAGLKSSQGAIEKKEMTSVIVKTATEEEFFERGRLLARLADAAEPIPEEHTVSFEEPADLLRLLTAAHLAVFRAVRDEPASITDLARRLHRDRSAVKRDVDRLARAGMVAIEDKVLPGRGRMKEVRSVTKSYRLKAVLASR